MLVARCLHLCPNRLPRALRPDEIIERGVREHPELSVGSNTDGIDVRSVGNSQVLQVSNQMTAIISKMTCIDMLLRDELGPRANRFAGDVFFASFALTTASSLCIPPQSPGRDRTT